MIVIGKEGDQGALISAVKAGADGYIRYKFWTILRTLVHQVVSLKLAYPSLMLGSLLRGLISLSGRTTPPERFSIGNRERDLLVGVQGLNLAIADQLHLSPHTVRAPYRT